MLKQEAMKELGVSLFRLNKGMEALRMTKIDDKSIFKLKAYFDGCSRNHLDVNTRLLTQLEELLNFINTFGYNTEYVKSALENMNKTRLKALKDEENEA